MRRLPCSGARIEEHMWALIDDDMWDILAGVSWNLGYSGTGRLDSVRTTTRQFSTKGIKENIFMHHVVVGKPPNGLIIDHIDRNPLNNQRANLRIASVHENNINSVRYNGGISYNKGRWVAKISFKTKEHALAAAKLLSDFRRTLYGEDYSD